jgi:hypothetical protein
MAKNLSGARKRPGVSIGGVHGGERFELLCRIGAEVDLGALQAGLSEPKRDLPDVPGRLKRMHGAVHAD